MAIDVEMKGALLEIRLFDVVTDADLVDVARAIADVEELSATTPSRLADLSAITRIDVGFAGMRDLALKRRETKLSGPIKSALVVASEVQFGMARMFQSMNTHPQIALQIFRNQADARAWLAE